MILETRIYNRATKTMVYMTPLKPMPMSLGAVPVGDKQDFYFASDDPVMLKSGVLDDFGEYVWEGDICQCGIETSIGMVAEQGIMVWDKSGFTLKVETPYGGQTKFQIVSVKKVGNVFDNADLIIKKQKHENINGK